MSDRITVQISHGDAPIHTIALSGHLPAAEWEQFKLDVEKLLTDKYQNLVVESRSSGLT